MFAAGVRQAEVARQLGVSAQAISVWHARWQTGGTEGLQSRGPSGPAPRLSDTQLAQVEQALPEGATAHGFVGELWTLDRIATLIERLTGVHHHPAGCGRCCTTGWAGRSSGPRVGNYDTDTLIEVLSELRRFLGGEKATLLPLGTRQQRWRHPSQLPAWDGATLVEQAAPLLG